MRYRDIKIVEALGPEVLARTISVQFDRDCKDVNRLNNNLTSLRRSIEKNPSSLNSIVTALKATGHNALANLLSQTTFPLTFNKDTAHSMPAYTADMCGGNGIAGTSQGNNKGVDQGNTSGQAPGANIATGDGTTANGGGITGIPSNQNNTGVTGDGQGSNKLKAAADELSRLLDKEDWQGANDLIKGDPNLQALLPDELISDLDAAIQAEADAKAADTAEEQRLADEVEEKRNDAIKADAARIAAKVADDKAAEVKAEKKAEASRIEAERLEQELEQQQTNPGSTPPTSIPDPNQPFDASDWGDDQSLKRFPVSELNAARSKYYVNLTREEELFFNTDGSIRSMTPIEQRELDALERERKELLKKYGDGILMVDKISTRFVGGDN